MSATHDPVRFWAVVRPDRVAIRGARSTWTYRQLDRAVWSTVDALLERRLGSGEHMALEFGVADAAAFAVTFHALHRIGLLPVMIRAEASPEERQALRERAYVDFTLTAGDLDIPEPEAKAPKPAASKPAAAEPKARDPRSAPGDTGSGPDDNLFVERRLDAPAAVCFTSGTSAGPRAVALTHGNFLWGAIASARNLGVRAEDLWLCCLPFHHVGGLSILTRSAYYGTAVLLQEGFDPVAVNRAIDEEGVTLVSLVPTMLERVLGARRGRPFPPTLRAALIGGGPMSGDLLEEAASLALRALPTYGLTEATSQVTTLPLSEWPRGLHTAGRPLPFTRVEIRSPEGRALKPREEGEIHVRGPTVMGGYLGDPAATEAAFSHRWLRTGDFGIWDEERRLIVLERRVDRIVSGGENVSAEEVERVLEGHPAVRGACVVALPSREWGQEVAAAVELAPRHSLTLEDARTYAARSLSDFKLPRHLLIVPALPRTESGKLLRRVIRERFLDEMAKQKHP